MKGRLWVAILVVIGLMPGLKTGAQTLDLSPEPDFKVGAPGETVTFSVRATNPSPTTVVVGGVTLSGTVYLNRTVSSPLTDLTVNDHWFYEEWPFWLDPNGGSYEGRLFDVVIDPSASPGEYVGSFDLLGGYEGQPDTVIASHEFHLTVTSATVVPEGEGLSLLAWGLLGPAGLLLKKQKAAKELS
jgi:hypothetical protein